MPQISDGWKKRWEENRSTFLACMIATFFWGLLAHAYVFLNTMMNHDSLVEFNAAIYSNVYRYRAGRVLVPVYRFIVRSPIALPWLIGMISLVYIGLAVFLAVKYFRIRSKWMILLTAGIFAVNVTIIDNAGVYLHDLDCNMLAMLLAVLAAYLWKRYDKGFLYGILPVALSLGIYQSYVSVTIVLIIFALLLFLIDGGKAKDAFAKGLRSLVMLIGGGVIYLILVKVVCSLVGIPLSSGEYNSLNASASLTAEEWVTMFLRGYFKFFYKFITAQSLYPTVMTAAVHLIIGGGICALGLGWMIAAKKHGLEKMLAVALVLVLPLGMNISYVLSGGTSHDLMHYAFWLLYLLPLLLIEHLWKRFDWSKRPVLRCAAWIPCCLVALVVWGNVQTANGFYLQRDLIAKANQSLLTRVIHDMEQTEGYIPGNTPVIFLGGPELEPIPGFENNRFMGSANHAMGGAVPQYCQAYFDYVMLNPAIMADDETWWNMFENEEALAMPSYPAQGSIRMIDGNLVVRMEVPEESEPESEEKQYSIRDLFFPS